MSRNEALALDRDDALAQHKQLFDLPAGMIYLDGNSLGPLPHATAQRLQQVVYEEWGRGLIGSWNSAHWVSLPERIGDKIARLVGAAPGELVVADSTSVNAYKALGAALPLALAARPERRVVLSERHNFPTDLYIAQSLARQHGCDLVLVDEPGQIGPLLDEGNVAVLMLTHVNYRSGRMHDMAALNRRARAQSTLTLWDLAHSAGAVPVDLNGDDADFAIGCGYKYLNGGPGAPAFVWAHQRHAAHCVQPLSGWFGHAAPFAFHSDYAPAPGSRRFLCGTPPVLAMAALECGVDSVLSAGGMAALRRKSLALSSLFIDLVDARCGGHGLALVTPRADALRGSQVSLVHPDAAYPIMQALIAHGVVGDFRAPDILRFGFTPLYTGFADVWDAVDMLSGILASGEWRKPSYAERRAVT
ncbi:kynureninase [Massilia sp. Root351]|nr:kynureninase [Massilia sp. Root351]